MNDFIMNDSDLSIKIKKLKKNPVFNMSLGGKELFHSNMLAMFLQDKNENDEPTQLATNLMNRFKPKNENDKELSELRIFDVLREKNNRDLIIIYTTKKNLEILSELEKKKENISLRDIDIFYDDSFNSVTNWKDIYDKNETEQLRNVLNEFKYVVVENKFKSFPYIEQLEKYTYGVSVIPNIPAYTKSGDLYKTKKSITAQNIDNTEFYLFAPKKTLDLFCENDDSNKNYTKSVTPKTKETNGNSLVWHGISYEDYLETIEKSENSSDSVTDSSKFLTSFISEYIAYVKNILNITKFIIENTLENNRCHMTKKQASELANGRIHDVCQKILSNAILSKLKENNIFKKDEKYKNLKIHVDYTHQQGLIDFSFINDNKINHGIQIQEGAFELNVTAEYRNKNDDDKSNDEIYETNKAVFESKENEIKEWLEEIYDEIKTAFNKESKEFKLTSENLNYNRDQSLKGYADQNKTYCFKYGYIDLKEISKDEDYRNIEYSTLQLLLEKSLEVLSKKNFKLN